MASTFSKYLLLSLKPRTSRPSFLQSRLYLRLVISAQLREIAISRIADRIHVLRCSSVVSVMGRMNRRISIFFCCYLDDYTNHMTLPLFSEFKLSLSTELNLISFHMWLFCSNETVWKAGPILVRAEKLGLNR